MADDPCRDKHRLLDKAAAALADLHVYYTKTAARLANMPIFAGGFEPIAGLVKEMKEAIAATAALAKDRVLLRGGIVELPSAGYLPVSPSSAETVNVQVKRLLGECLDLRFCIVRPDYVPHALEEAQHMERISLTDGLDKTADKPKVDILVPDGQFLTGTGETASATPRTLPCSPRWSGRRARWRIWSAATFWRASAGARNSPPAGRRSTWPRFRKPRTTPRRGSSSTRSAASTDSRPRSSSPPRPSTRRRHPMPRNPARGRSRRTPPRSRD